MCIRDRNVPAPEHYALFHRKTVIEILFLLLEQIEKFQKRHRKPQPRACLLYTSLPGLSGEEILPLIKGIPVIVVSAKAEVSDKVELLLNGACDYITKPFDTAELRARITVQLRMAESAPASVSVLCFRTIRLDTASHSVTVADTPVRLTQTEYAILKLLMQNPSQVITKTLILERISEDTPDCTESSLKVHISNLLSLIHI